MLARTNPAERSSSSSSSGRSSTASRAAMPRMRVRAVGQLRRGPEVEHAQPAVRQAKEVPRVRIGVQQPCPLRGGEVELRQQIPDAVALRAGPAPDDLRQRGAGDPLGDQHLGRTGHHGGHRDLRVPVIGGVEGPLSVRLAPIVQLLDHPVAQLCQQRLDLEAGHDRLEQPAEPLQQQVPRRTPRSVAASPSRVARRARGAPRPAASGALRPAAWSAPPGTARPARPGSPPRTRTVSVRTSWRHP